MSKIWIAHRGNISGPNPSRENQPSYINEALDLGYDVEIDCWLLNNIYYLGHDKPEYIVPREYLFNTHFWIHCKNLAVLDELTLEPDINCFAHDKDEYVLTSKLFIWVYPHNIKLTSNCIAVMPERVKNWDLSKAYGICTDYILSYQRWEEEGKI